MPIYEYYCRTCHSGFSQLCPISRADDPSHCTRGHRAVKTISLTAPARVGGATGVAEAEESVASSGGCACGRGACACGAPN